MECATEIKIRGYHADFYGHVNNARYLEFLEEDRWSWLEEHIDLQKWSEKNLTFVAVNININYRKVLNVGETIVVSTRIEKISVHSVVLLQEIVVKNTQQCAADALVTFVIIDRDGGVLSLDDPRIAELQKLLQNKVGG